MYPGREAGAAERWAPGSRSWVLEQLSQEWMGEFRKFEFKKNGQFSHKKTFLDLLSFQASGLLPF